MATEHVILEELPRIETLLKRHLSDLQAFIRVRCDRAIRERESCSDLAQSVCREVLQAKGFEYRGEIAFRRWLFSKASSKIHDRRRYYRAKKRDISLERGNPSSSHGSSVPTPSELAIVDETMAKIEEALGRLPRKYREVISLSKIEGLGKKEIAGRLRCSEDSVRNMLHRGLRRLSWILSREA